MIKSIEGNTTIRRVRVLMAVPQYPYPVVGGLERQAHCLAQELVAIGATVTALSGKVKKDQSAREVVEGIPVVRFVWPRNKVFRFFLVPLLLSFHLIRLRKDYDEVHLHNISWFGISAILLTNFLGKPVISKLPNVGGFGLPGMKKGFLGNFKLKTFLSSDSIVAMSEESRKELLAEGYPEPRIFMVTNGVSALTQTTASPLRSDPSGPLRIVFIGRLSPQKGIMDLLDIWPRIVASSIRHVRLELWGDGPQEKDIRRRIEILDCSDSIWRRGQVSEVQQELTQVDILVLPSYAEGNSNAILEAMAAGVSVISTDVGGTPLLLGDAGRRWLYAPGDKKTLKTLLLELIEDDKGRERYGKAMRRRALEFFHMRSIAERYLAAYHCLAEGRREEIGALSSPVFKKLAHH